MENMVAYVNYKAVELKTRDVKFQKGFWDTTLSTLKRYRKFYRKRELKLVMGMSKEIHATLTQIRFHKYVYINIKEKCLRFNICTFILKKILCWVLQGRNRHFSYQFKHINNTLSIINAINNHLINNSLSKNNNNHENR